MKENSAKTHDETQYNNDDLNFWIKHNKIHQEDNVFNNNELKLKKLIDNNKNVRKLAIDIGSGAGWLSYKLSEIFEKVIAIEPSEKAVNISKKIYNNASNIEWIVGYAEDVFPIIENKNNEPTLFTTCSVFQHLENEYVLKVLKWINENAPINSILGFQELWGQELHLNMHHVRQKEWWINNLSNWELDFHGPKVLENTNKGIHGIKIK